MYLCFVLFLVCCIDACECLLQNNIHVSEVHCWSAVRFGQALPGFHITAHHLWCAVCVSVIGLLAVWRHEKLKSKNQKAITKVQGDWGSGHPRLSKGDQGEVVRRRFSIMAWVRSLLARSWRNPGTVHWFPNISLIKQSNTHSLNSL